VEQLKSWIKMKHHYLTDQVEIDRIIERCEVCYVSMVDEQNQPYVVPFNFGYEKGIIYLHSSQRGLKINILKQNPAVCIAFSTDHQLRFQSEQVACSYSMKYRSVLAFGKVEFVEDIDQKRDHLNKVMLHYTQKPFTFNPPSLREVCTFKVNVEKFTARVYGY
jgi:hypothetical protein